MKNRSELIPVDGKTQAQMDVIATARKDQRLHAKSQRPLPEYAALMARPPGNDLLDDLDAIRGDR